MNALQEAAAAIRAGTRFMVAAHAAPDGDALGSMLATAHGLRTLGKEVFLYNEDAAPKRLAFLEGAKELRSSVPTGVTFDATLVHDCGAASLLGHRFPSREVTGPLIILDHHASVSDFGDIVVRDASASAVGVLVARLYKELGVALSRPMAEALWCSLVSDTGWFRYSATNVETLELATACVQAGVEPWNFARWSEEEWPPARLRLLSLSFASLELWPENRPFVALLRLDDKMLSEAGAGPDLGEGLVNYARALQGIEVGILLTSVRAGIRVSLRSKGGLDVGKVASQFGGGGHVAAAGCFFSASLDEAKAHLLTALAAAGS